MAKIGFLLPGQGSQYVGMAKDIFDRFPEVKDMYEHASDILGYDIKKIAFEGPIEELTRTRICQPAIFLHTMALIGQLDKRGIRPLLIAGHSLGEHVSLAATGSLGFDDGLRLVKARGELVQEASDQNPGSMAAIIGLEDGQVEELCRTAAQDGVLVPANFNAPSQIVISGTKDALRRGMEMAKGMGAKKVVELQVSGAFHSPLMQSARDGLEKVMEGMPIKDARLPIVSNVTARPMQSAGELRINLVRQLTSPVRWRESMETMIAAGIEEFIEIGPGRVLQGLLKRVKRDASSRGIDTAPELDAALNDLA